MCHEIDFVCDLELDDGLIRFWGFGFGIIKTTKDNARCDLKKHYLEQFRLCVWLGKICTFQFVFGVENMRLKNNLLVEIIRRICT